MKIKDTLETFTNLSNEDRSGFAEIVIPPNSSVIGKTLKDIAFRKTYNIEPIVFITREGEKQKLKEIPFESGIQVVVFGRWENIIAMRSTRDFTILTNLNPPEPEPKKDKKIHALISIILALGLVFFWISAFPQFFSGALLMILLGVIPKEEMYSAIDWKTVFLLGGLIPLGTAFQNSGATNFTATAIINMVGSCGTLAILFVIGIITMLFSLFMSNVAATVLLVPLAIMMAKTFHIEPTGLALWLEYQHQTPLSFQQTRSMPIL